MARNQQSAHDRGGRADPAHTRGYVGVAPTGADPHLGRAPATSSSRATGLWPDLYRPADRRRISRRRLRRSPRRNRRCPVQGAPHDLARLRSESCCPSRRQKRSATHFSRNRRTNLPRRWAMSESNHRHQVGHQRARSRADPSTSRWVERRESCQFLAPHVRPLKQRNDQPLRLTEDSLWRSWLGFRQAEPAELRACAWLAIASPK